jgi:hypothetical protein
MFTFQHLTAWRNRRWRAALSALRRPTLRSYTLRELLKSLETYRDSDAIRSSYLGRLTALVKEDLANAERFPHRSGGPDTRRPLAAWRARYNHLGRYVPTTAAPDDPGPPLATDDASRRALAAAENEGWPPPRRERAAGRQRPRAHRS